MTRVTENSAFNSVQFSVNRSKNKLEDLQLKGTTLKRITKPSDDPVSNVEVLLIRSQQRDNDQYLKNATFAKMRLELAENAIVNIISILNKAKELSIAQSSDFYGPDIRKNVSLEVRNLTEQLMGIANQRVGNRYLFAGQSTLTIPFDSKGIYQGDDSIMEVEIAKDFFLPTNIPGSLLFYQLPPKMLDNSQADTNLSLQEFLKNYELEKSDREQTKNDTLFVQLKSLENALLTNDTEQVQNLLQRIDASVEQSIKIQTMIGIWMNTLDHAYEQVDQKIFTNEKQKSILEDADVAQLFSDLNKQENLLKASYKISAGLLNKSLLDYLK